MTDENKPQHAEASPTNDTSRSIEAHVAEKLDASLNELSAHAQQRLYAARQQALRQARTNSAPTELRWSWQDWWKPAVPVAAAVAFVAVIFLMPPNDVVPQFNGTSEQEMELLLSDDEFEMLEDLEFYAWLAEVESG